MPEGEAHRRIQDVTVVSESDVGDLLPLLRAYCDFYDTRPDDAALRALVQALIDDPAHEGMQLMARDRDGAALGFATVYWMWSTADASRIAVMNDLFVREDARGGGVGEALIEGCRQAAARRGASRLTWQTAPDNVRAQRLYDRIGGHREQWIDYWLPCRA